jgi:tetratricopeptide (TPR) repeat protein
MSTRQSLSLLAFACLVAACSSAPDSNSREDATPQSRAALVARAGAPLFDGMGTYHRAITTADAGAQQYFDQGMVLAFGFNHAEAIRSFRAAQRLDDQCAMCYWGEALATGPNINVTSKGRAVMSDDEQVAAHIALEKAVERKVHANELERALIDALATRYAAEPTADRAPLDRAYAQAMGELVKRYPQDDDAAALFAEAWMDTMPWDYWSANGDPKPETVEVISALEAIIARSPRHPLALHLYIHAVEASAAPGRAETAADTLTDLVPGSGHLVHMPSHIYYRIGRYHDASEANVRAASVDEGYIAQCNAQGFYPAAYYPHNIHFLWSAATMEGRGGVAIEAARKVAANVHLEQIEQYPGVEFYKTIPLLALIQFGHWDEILAEPEPAENLSYSRAIRHYARGVARVRQGDLDEAHAERAALVPLRDAATVHFLDSIDYPASALLAIADELLLGEIGSATGEIASAIEHFEQAVQLQDALPYTEPPFWYYPTRQSLGLALLTGGRAVEAEQVYRRDLEDYPRNGWSLYGLIQALEAQSKLEEVDALKKRFATVWSEADVQLPASRI